MTSGSKKVLCAGRVYCDLIFTGVPRLPSMGTEVFADGLGLHAGGGAYITAAHLAALGRSAGLAATLPGGVFKDVVTQAIQEADLDSALCQPASDATDPQITVAMVGASDRAFLTRRAGAAVPRFPVSAMAGFDHLHIGELGTLVEAPWLLDVARDAGASVSLDCGWEDAHTASVGALIAQVDLFLPNSGEARLLEDLGVPQPWAPVTIVKEGANGATAISGDDRLHVAALDVTPVDTTGAGDAFNAGFIDAWLAGSDLPECLISGHRCAAHAITSRGGFVPRVAAAQ